MQRRWVSSSSSSSSPQSTSRFPRRTVASKPPTPSRSKGTSESTTRIVSYTQMPKKKSLSLALAIYFTGAPPGYNCIRHTRKVVRERRDHREHKYLGEPKLSWVKEVPRDAREVHAAPPQLPRRGFPPAAGELPFATPSPSASQRPRSRRSWPRESPSPREPPPRNHRYHGGTFVPASRAPRL